MLKTVGFWALKGLLRSLAGGIRRKVDTAEERREIALMIYTSQKERIVGYIERMLEKGNKALDKIDGD